MFSKVVTGLNWNTLDQYQCFHGFPKYLSVLHLIAFTIQVPRRKQLLQTIWVFQAGRSTGHAIIQLADKIFEAFENNPYTLGVFIDLHKLLIQQIIQYCFKHWNYMLSQKNKKLDEKAYYETGNNIS